MDTQIAPHRPRKRTPNSPVALGSPAATIIDKFGGLSNFSTISGKSKGTVYRWMCCGIIPIREISAVKALGAKHGIVLTDSDFIPRG